MPSYVAGGNIAPSRFTEHTATEGQVTQCGNTEKMNGVSQQGTRRTPHEDIDDGYAAISGENIRVYGPGEICWLEAGGTVAVDDRLGSDADGKGVATTSDNAWVGAKALTPAVSGQLCKVMVIEPHRY